MPPCKKIVNGEPCGRETVTRGDRIVHEARRPDAPPFTGEERRKAAPPPPDPPPPDPPPAREHALTRRVFGPKK